MNLHAIDRILYNVDKLEDELDRTDQRLIDMSYENRRLKEKIIRLQKQNKTLKAKLKTTTS